MTKRFKCVQSAPYGASPNRRAEMAPYIVSGAVQTIFSMLCRRVSRYRQLYNRLQYVLLLSRDQLLCPLGWVWCLVSLGLTPNFCNCNVGFEIVFQIASSSSLTESIIQLSVSGLNAIQQASQLCFSLGCSANNVNRGLKIGIQTIFILFLERVSVTPLRFPVFGLWRLCHAARCLLSAHYFQCW